MKKLMFAVAACAFAGVASAEWDLAGVNVYDYKASVKHTYLKEKKLNSTSRDSIIPRGTSLYIKYTKSSSLKGYLIQDLNGSLSVTNVEDRFPFMVTNNAAGAPFSVRNITGKDPQPGNRCFLVVQNSSAEKGVRTPRIVPGVLDAKWYDPKLTDGNRSTPAQGYLYLGGEVVARTKNAELASDQYSGFVGTLFNPALDEITGYRGYYPEATDEELPAADKLVYARKFWEQQRNPAVDGANYTNTMPWYVTLDGFTGLTGAFQFGTRTCDFGIDDYFFTSCFLFGQYNQPTWYGEGDIQEFADCWLNGAGIGKAKLIAGKQTACCGKAIVLRRTAFTLYSLAGNLKAGIYLCTENGDDSAHSLDIDRTGWFEDQFWAPIQANSYAQLNVNHSYTDDYYAWYRKNIWYRGVVDGHNYMVKQDIWADGNLDLRTTDVGYGTWSIKLNDNFAKGLDKSWKTVAAAKALIDADVRAMGFKATETYNAVTRPYGTADIMLAIAAAQYKLNKNAALFGDPTFQDVDAGMINWSFYYNYLAEGYDSNTWVTPIDDPS